MQDNHDSVHASLLILCAVSAAVGMACILWVPGMPGGILGAACGFICGHAARLGKRLLGS